MLRMVEKINGLIWSDVWCAAGRGSSGISARAAYRNLGAPGGRDGSVKLRVVLVAPSS